MARLNDLPFERGSTWFSQGAGSTSPNTTDGQQLLGKEYLVEDTNNGTNAYVRLRIVQNKSGFALAPKRLVVSTPGAGLDLVAGYANVNPMYCAGVVDDQYINTIADKDIFYMVVEGPVLVKTGLIGDTTNQISAGDFLVNTTGATTAATTGGRAITNVLTGSTTPLAQNIEFAWGRAMSAATTTNTDSDLLCDCFKRY